MSLTCHRHILDISYDMLYDLIAFTQGGMQNARNGGDVVEESHGRAGSAVAARDLRAHVYRVIQYDDPLNTQGPRLQDGRYHLRGEWEAVYLSEQQETCWREIEAKIGARVVRENYNVFEVEVDLGKVADLTEQESLVALGVTLQDLVRGDWSVCQGLARRLRDEGFEAILTWSAADRDAKNLVIFKDLLRDDSKLGPWRLV